MDVTLQKEEALKLKARNQQHINDIKRVLDLPVLTSPSYVVQISGITIDPEIVNQKTTSNFVFSFPHLARRFSLENAMIIAASVHNGAGEKGEAVHWSVASKELLKSLEAMNDEIDTYIANLG